MARRMTGIMRKLVNILLAVWLGLIIVGDVIDWEVDLHLTLRKELVAYDAKQAEEFLRELQNQGTKTKVFGLMAA